MKWRKLHKSMFEGSMVGAGAVVFALMSYIVSHQEYERASGWVVRLNPVLLGTIIGEKAEEIERAIAFLCAADKNSTSKRENGKRLVRVGKEAMEYRVVNGDKYQEEREYEDRKEQNRLAQQRHRQKVQTYRDANGVVRTLDGGVYVEPGESTMAMIGKAVDKDPITKKDKAVMDAKWKEPKPDSFKL